MTLESFGFASQGGPQFATLVLGFASALLATLGLTPIARWFATSAGVVDRPDGGRKLQKFAVPLLGGVAVFGGFCAAVLALLASSSLDSVAPRVPLILLGVGTLCMVGIVDDIWNLPAGRKLVGQILSVVPIVWAGLWVQKVGFCGLTLDVGIWGIPLTVAWFIACINAVNLLDGMDGLASTIGLAIALGIASIGLVTGADATVVLAVAVAGSLAGFLVYNFPPATIYLGDAGSMVIGLLLAVLTLQAGVDSAGRSSLTIMVVLMAVPIADTGLAVIRRALNGQGIWSPDRGHLHHRLLDRGFSSAYILRFVSLVCGLTGAIATVSRIVGWDTLAWCASGALGVLLVRARLIGHHEWSLGRRFLGERLYVESFELPVPEQLRAMSFEMAWSALVQIAEMGSASRLQLLIEGQGARRQHDWTRPNQHDAREDRISIELALRAADRGWCRLRIESVERPSSGSAPWPLLVVAARRFARHWAKHPESVPVTGLRLYSDDASSTSDVHDRQLRPAA
jgi:UDP-GlcNAc:undecaprenyl-phosphate GlcNAc-1-phosphate transferase